MKNETKTPRPLADRIYPMPSVVERATFQAEVAKLRIREKAYTREGDAIAAARRRLPMVEVDANLALIGPYGPLTLLDAFEGRRQLIAYYFMWNRGRPAAEQCEGCTWVTSQVTELSYLHLRNITYAVFCKGSYDESIRYHDFMNWDMPWYSALPSLDSLLVGDRGMALVCYLRDGDRVFETYWTTIRGLEAMDNSYALMDPHPIWAAGDLGRLARWLAARGQHADPSHKRAPYGSVVAARGWTLRRSRYAPWALTIDFRQTTVLSTRQMLGWCKYSEKIHRAYPSLPTGEWRPIQHMHSPRIKASSG